MSYEKRVIDAFTRNHKQLETEVIISCKTVTI